jgi:DNA-binding NarL/FixJ family response regulator
LVIAVREVLRGKRYISPTVAKDGFEFFLCGGEELVDERNSLTGRQRQVLQLLAEGKSTKEVGSVLKITIRTVFFHKYRIMEVLNAKSNAKLIQYAVKHHLIAA